MHSFTVRSSSILFLALTPPPFHPSLILSFQSTSTTTTKRPHVRLHVLELKKKPLRKNKGGNFRKGLCCNKDWESNSASEEGDGLSPLEEEILEFMKSSKNPQAFPTKEDLMAAGRVDLAYAIVRRGGWLAFGWDLDGGSRESHDFDGGVGGGGEVDGVAAATRASGIASSSSSYDSEGNSGQPARSVEVEAEDSGIEGILNRLEKERSNSLGLGFREKGESVSSKNNEDKDECDRRTTVDAVAADLRDSSRPSSSSRSSPHDGFHTKRDQHRSHLDIDNFRNSPKPDNWRSWMVQRTGFSDADFEDAEIAPYQTRKGDEGSVSGQPDFLKVREFSGEPVNKETGLGSLDGNANHCDVKSRIQHLDFELSSVLHSLRSKSDKLTMQMDQNSSSDDLAKLSDTWEFQENEIINAQDKLRSIRAKLAVLEGKMALAIMDAHKIVEEKQKRIHKAQRALQALKTTCIVWPNTASEVFFAGSFDGWSTQRKMEKSSTGIFSLYLQLYPGRYEIKFIVDGEWKIDPLRPIVNNNGYENNLLVIHD